MKLRNLLFATMFACAFASCSSDDDPTIDPTPAEAADAYLDITIDAKTISSKAEDGDNYAQTGETTVNNLTIAVFNASTHALISSRRATEGKGDEDFTKTSASSGATYEFNTPLKVKAIQVEVYVLANVPEAILKTANKLSDYEAALATLATQKVGSNNNGLTMSTKLLKSTNALLDAKTAPVENPNMMGYVSSAEHPVAGCTDVINLQRVAARVQIGNVYSTTFKEQEKVVITGVYMFNVRSDSKLLVKDDASLDYESEKQSFEAGKDDNIAPYIGDYKVKDETLSENEALRIDLDEENYITIDKNTTSQSPRVLGKSFYVMPNNLLSVAEKDATPAYTLISVKGKYTNPEGVEMPGDRWYTIIVGKTGVESGEGKVVRNTVYDIATLDLTGSGSDSPYTPQVAAYLNAQVQVKAWSFVTQTAVVD
ncbi:fimbrial protein [Parabacteroides gordonii]|uniref:fimbrial protein n=1 Tax=Parabacteroides gordonii TaxID=574930 RepID=UPI0026EA3FF0|nr:fimbrial protein [Parabacteroides gordonii]